MQRIFFNNALFASGETGYRLFASRALTLRATPEYRRRKKNNSPYSPYRVHALRGASRVDLFFTLESCVISQIRAALICQVTARIYTAQ